MTTIVGPRWLACIFATLGLAYVPRAFALDDDPDDRACASPDAREVWERASGRDEPVCPSLTRQQGDLCVLDGDITIAAPLRLESFTHLHCRGHRILPITPATGTPPAATTSVPEVAIVVDHDTYGVTIEDCLIGGDAGDVSHGFDFGIYVRGAKLAREGRAGTGRNARLKTRIKGNTINARQTGIGLAGADNVTVSENHLYMANPGCAGVEIGPDSDGNRVTNNTIARISNVSPPSPRKRAPGFPPVTPATAMGILVSSNRATPVFQSIVDGVLFQTPQVLGCIPLNEDNVIEGNTVDMNRAPGAPVGVVIHTGIVVMDFAMRTDVRGNTVKNGVRGLTVNTSSTPTLERAIAGVCVGGSGAGRPCGVDADCRMFAPMYTDTVAGQCSGAGVAAPTNDPVPHDTLIEGNRLVGSYEGASIQTGIGMTIRKNTIVDSDIDGISLAGHALSNATLVTRNVITSATGPALQLVHPMVRRFGILYPPDFQAQVTLNDFTVQASPAIVLSSIVTPPESPPLIPGYFLPSELSSNLRGNYWGRACADDDGFREFGQPGADSPAAFVIDSYPFGQSVATTPVDLLPQPCPH